MTDVKKGVARIQVPPKAVAASEPVAGVHAPGGSGPDPLDSRGVQMLMSGAVPAKRDPLTVPLVGLVLAFSVISLIIQMLIAFS
jgi:hypothetical protein